MAQTESEVVSSGFGSLLNSEGMLVSLRLTPGSAKKDAPLSGDMFKRDREPALRLPAQAPIPTTGKFLLGFLDGSFADLVNTAERRFEFFFAGMETLFGLFATIEVRKTFLVADNYPKSRKISTVFAGREACYKTLALAKERSGVRGAGIGQFTGRAASPSQQQKFTARIFSAPRIARPVCGLTPVRNKFFRIFPLARPLRWLSPYR